MGIKLMRVSFVFCCDVITLSNSWQLLFSPEPWSLYKSCRLLLGEVRVGAFRPMTVLSLRGDSVKRKGKSFSFTE